MNTSGVSVIIPTCNMASDLERLLSSISRVNNIAIFSEIIIVNDGSIDNTSEVVADFVNRNKQLNAKEIKMVPGVGRYMARLEGARGATCEELLFLDTRLELAPDFADNIEKLLKNHEVVHGTVQIKTNESIYSLYWDRSHRKIFDRHFKDQQAGFFLTQENFENYTCGMGVFLCRKEIFQEACKQIGSVPLSDDRELIFTICKAHNIWLTQDLTILWWPRQNLSDFLGRLWERGITFVEYHVISHRTFLAWPVYVGLVILFLNLLWLIYFPKKFIFLLFVEMILIAISTLWLTRNPLEFLKLLPLHVLVVIVFGLGVLRGLIVNAKLMLMGKKL